MCKQTTSIQHPPKTTSLVHPTSWMLRVQADNKHPTFPEDYITGTSDIMDVTCANRQQASSIPQRLHHWYIRHHGCYVCKQTTSIQHSLKTTSLAHLTSWMLRVQADNKHPTSPEDYITGTSDIMDVTCASRQQAPNIPRRLHHWHIGQHGCYVYKQTTSTQHPLKTTSLAHPTSWMLRVQADNKHPTFPEDYITGTSDIMDVTCASRQQAPNIPRRLHHWHIRHHGCYVCKQATSTQHPPKTTSLAHPTSWMLCVQANNKHPTFPEDYITGTSDIMDVTCASRQQASNIPRRLHHWHIRHHGCYVCKQTTSI